MAFLIFAKKLKFTFLKLIVIINHCIICVTIIIGFCKKSYSERLNGISKYVFPKGAKVGDKGLKFELMQDKYTLHKTFTKAQVFAQKPERF